MTNLLENNLVLTSPIKQMEYAANGGVFEILAQGIYLGFQFVIVNYGWHPCSYVSVPKGHPCYEVDYDEWGKMPDCHGSVTYSEHGYVRNNCSYISEEFWVLGWDYGHVGDFVGYYIGNEYFEAHNHKWTTAELLKEVKEVIVQLDLTNYKKAYK